MSQSEDENRTDAANMEDAPQSVFEVLPASHAPEADAVIEEIPFTSPNGRAFTIVRTSELDAYEKGFGMEEDELVARNSIIAAIPGDDYRGKQRMAAKLSKATAAFEEFNDLADLIASLPSIEAMVALKPKIKTGPGAGRVAQENRNIRINTFLYAASREDDNDFHLILGRAPNLVPKRYLTMEISGLPDTSNINYPASGLPDPSDPAYSKTVEEIRQARQSFKDFFGADLPGLGYDFYPALPVLMEGSLFFDMTHSSGNRPGPQKLSADMPTIWELHPVTKIVFK